MKFIKLTIHNIASIEDAVIDFENGPLAEDSRFLICGPTGAGKTTILDSICLVLYGTTPRLNIKKVEGYVDYNENFTLGKDREDIKIDDTRMLMRRGSLNAFVELIFTDKDDCRLKAVWRCNRAHNKPDGNIKTPEWNLFDERTEVAICLKKPETLKEISRRIGLSFDQFCRTTMLAQGDFTKFLKSDEGEKSQILEKLTGTDIYSEISMCIHTRKAEKELLCQQVKSKMEGVQLLSSEEETRTVNELNNAQKRLLFLNSEETKIGNNIQWINQLENFIKQLDECSRQLIEVTQTQQTEAFKREQAMLIDWDKTGPQREVWKELQLSQQVVERQNKELENLQNEYSRLCRGLNSLQRKLEEKIAIKDKIKKYLLDQEPNIDSYNQISLIETYASQLKEASSRIKEIELRLLNKTKSLGILSLQLQNKIENVNKYDSLIQQKDQEIAAVSVELRSLDYDSLLKKRGEVDSLYKNLKDYRLIVEQCLSVRVEFDTKGQVLKDEKTKINQYTVEKASIEKTIAQLEIQVSQQQFVFEQQQRACGDLMNEYRSFLSVGDRCPLCGQVINELTTDEQFVSILQPVKQLLDKLCLQLKGATTHLSDIKAQLSFLVKDSCVKTKELSDIQQRLATLEQRRDNHPLFVSYGSKENPLDGMDEALTAIMSQLSSLDADLKKVGNLQISVAKLQKEKENILNAKQLLQSEIQRVEMEQAKLNESSLADRNEITRTTQTLQETQARLAQFVDANRCNTTIDDLISQLKTGAERYKIATEKEQSVEVHIREIQNELRQILEIKEKIELIYMPWKDLTIATMESVDRLSSAWVDLQTRLGITVESLNAANKSVRDAKDSLCAYFACPDAVSKVSFKNLVLNNPAEIETLRKKHQQNREELVRLTAQKESAEQNLVLHKNKRPIMDENITRADLEAFLSTTKKELNECNQLMGKLAQRLETNHKNRSRYAEIEEELAKVTDDFNRWAHLHKLFGSNDGKKFRNIAQSYVLEQLLANANQYLYQFSKRYEMVCQPGSLTILLRDKEVGGVVRPTTTISGGESFLISLSLALGLSSLSKASYSMDTLFIDEGFGTLDSTYLSSVMDALDRLHQLGGKKIGIISHVESLKERLTTQIQVSRINNTSSRVDVVSLI